MPAPDPKRIEQAIRRVRNQESFVQELLVGALDWPVDPDATSVEEISYQWSTEDLKAEGLDEKVVQGAAHQIVLPGNPWGIFILEFKHPEVFEAGRGMTGTLRRVLRGLVPKKRAIRNANLKSFHRENLLFICNHKYEHFRFAYFKAPKDKQSQTAPLAAFGWGPGDPIRTLCDHNLSSLAWPDAAPADEPTWIDAWAQAFSVEKVTRRFYEDYRRVFEKVEGLIAKAAGLKGDELRMYTQTLFNRLMFLRFIERKGWLQFPGQEDRNYLSTLFVAGGVGKRSFFNARLEPLFFEGLAAEGQQTAPAYGTVPFLNGGLFERSALDQKVTDLPDRAFAEVIAPPTPADDGGLFYRYNFTVQESTPLEIEVAVDPEMLGKVFEELVTGRHEQGAYYTPRPIVSYMCREALKGYLVETTKLDPNDVSAFVDHHETPFGIEAARHIAAALDAVRAVDPACGSGAYLLGLLHEIVELYRLLYSDKLKKDDRDLQQIKLNVIEKSLYGVDIDPFATNIAMLRLWLSLAVDSKTPQSLPNLDFKVETGDSVAGPNPQEFSVLHLQERARQLAIIKGKYMRARGEQKRSLKRLVEKEQQEIAFELRSLCPGAIDWRVQFCEVFFSERGGFDIVLANPPYVRQEIIRSQKAALQKAFPDIYSGTADLCCYFYGRAVQLLKPDGCLAFISSNKWMRADYGETLRVFLRRHTRPNVIVDFGHSPVFPAADTFPCLPVLTRRGRSLGPSEFAPAGQTFSACLLPRDHYNPEMNLGRYVGEHAHELPIALLKDELWLLEGPRVHRLLDRLRNTGVPLKEFCKSAPLYGLKSGLNEAFYVDEQTRTELLAADPRSAELIKPLLRGRDIDRWRAAKGATYILLVRRGTDINAFPAVKRHLARYRAALEKRAGPQAWYELQASPSDAFVEVMSRPKLVYQEIQYHSWFALDVVGACINNKVFMLPTDDLALLGVLCSPLMWWVLTRTLPHMKDEALCPAGFIMENLRVCTGSAAKAEELRRLVAALIRLADEQHQWEARFAAELCKTAGLGAPDPKTIDWLSQPLTVFARRLAALSNRDRGPAELAREVADSYEHGRARRIELLREQLELERTLAARVEDVYGLSAEERCLLRETRPVRDPLDVLSAKVAELTGAADA